MPLCKTEKGLLADPFSVLQSDRAKPASEKPQVLSDALRGKQGDALRSKQSDTLRSKQGAALRSKAERRTRRPNAWRKTAKSLS